MLPCLEDLALLYRFHVPATVTFLRLTKTDQRPFEVFLVVVARCG